MATTTEIPSPRTELPRVLTLRDLVLFNIAAILGLRWTATAGAAGPSSLTLWVLAAVLFFIPQGIAVSYLSRRLPQEGGIYFWTKHSFGEGHGFLCGWCYWVNNVLYYPNLLMSTAVIATYAIGRGETGLMDDWTYILIATLTALWFAVLLNIVGLKTGRWLQNIGGLGTYIPGAVLIGFGLHAMLTRAPATPITLETITPRFGDLSQLNLWASIAFAYAGLELCAVMGDEIKNPRRTLPLSIYVAAPLIAFLYIAGTASVLWLVPSGEVNIVSGFLQALSTGAQQFGALLSIVPAAAALYVVGNLGGIGAWLTGPARVAFVIGLDRYFPPAFGRVHHRTPGRRTSGHPCRHRWVRDGVPHRGTVTGNQAQRRRGTEGRADRPGRCDPRVGPGRSVDNGSRSIRSRWVPGRPEGRRAPSAVPRPLRHAQKVCSYPIFGKRHHHMNVLSRRRRPCPLRWDPAHRT